MQQLFVRQQHGDKTTCTAVKIILTDLITFTHTGLPQRWDTMSMTKHGWLSTKLSPAAKELVIAKSKIIIKMTLSITCRQFWYLVIYMRNNNKQIGLTPHKSANADVWGGVLSFFFDCFVGQALLVVFCQLSCSLCGIYWIPGLFSEVWNHGIAHKQGHKAENKHDNGVSEAEGKNGSQHGYCHRKWIQHSSDSSNGNSNSKIHCFCYQSHHMRHNGANQVHASFCGCCCDHSRVTKVVIHPE